MNGYILTNLATSFGHHEGVSHWAVSYRATGKGDFFRRLMDGHTCTIATFNRILQWFSNHWPAGLPWPPDIPRPTPTESVTEPSNYRNGAHGAPTTAPAPTTRKDILATVEQLLATDPGEPPNAEAKQAAIQVACVLNAKGRIASPKALCLALEMPLYIYDQAVRRYSDGKPGQYKRPKTKGGRTDRMLTMLAKSGDGRFAARRERPARGLAAAARTHLS